MERKKIYQKEKRAEKQIEQLKQEKTAEQKQWYQDNADVLEYRISQLPRLFQHRIALMQFAIEDFNLLFLADILRAFEWSIQILQNWNNDMDHDQMKKVVDDVCGTNIENIDWKYFAIEMAIALRNDMRYSKPLDVALTMTIVAPLPIWQSSHSSQEMLTHYLRSQRCYELEKQLNLICYEI